MIRDITIGQYYPIESRIHGLDPRTKLAMTFGFIISLFFGTKLLVYLIAATFLAIVIKISKVPFKYMVKGLKSIMILIIFTVVINIFMTQGDPIFTWRFLTITREGVILAFSMAIRLILLTIGSSILTLTTSPIDLTDAIERLLKPFEKIHVPAHEIAMMMTIALRFIPILLEETDKIMKAQMARGADFETGGLIKKAKSLVPLLVPLFISAFRRADELALAMEARCYRGGKGRTRMKTLAYKKQDFIAYILIAFYIIGMLGLGFFL
jgi:energy-coupling factor transport system permease protein